ncbi:MAG: hypothetical protein V8Q27_02555 [Eubacteriales bacterium]
MEFKMDCSWGPRCRRCSWRMAVITSSMWATAGFYEITGTGIRQLTRISPGRRRRLKRGS